MSNLKIAPSILASDFINLKEQIRMVQEGGADWLHLDVMDGHFVPNITIGPPIIKSIRRHTNLPLDVHLMIEDADRYLEAFRSAGADHITVHQEACIHLHRTINRIRELGALAGVALNPATPVGLLSEIMPDIDLVLIMSVNPGFGGQRFIPGCLQRIREVKRMAKEIDLHRSGRGNRSCDGTICRSRGGECAGCGNGNLSTEEHHERRYATTARLLLGASIPPKKIFSPLVYIDSSKLSPQLRTAKADFTLRSL